MKKIGLLFLTLFLNLNLSYSQTKSEIDSLLTGIAETENSKGIIKTEQAEKIKEFGEKSLIVLAEFFTDSTLTKVKSDCHNRNLTKGEIAIIIADRIEGIPYFTVFRIQNCTLTFCENNPNRVEYYLGVNNEIIQERYMEWLYSKDRLKNVKGKDRKKRKRIINEWKNTSR
ncbi:hypothetical protein [Lacinutrix sp. 5H-3-7-4]|uniref:hypothetical protein n=1 Tax=Lacinutrix sp. (strain 5H-3-7-4) TaxID=983544 RepID=UPI00020A3BAE|nr:hypothetical protein [Lacinutrix sp. 5H-3-7-4]AEH02726.1 hypothetical protein Lacal_2888 [Lacinutrix sp. 5H-3-7-4]